MLTVAQISAQVDAVLGRDGQARTLAIKAEQKQSWPESLHHRGRRVRLRWCESSLALREALSEDTTSEGDDALVLLTPLATFDLPDDVAARIAKGRVYQPEGWAMVRELFAAKEVDARLSRYTWMPQLLIDLALDGYEPVPSGFLDLESAWRAVLTRTLGLDNARPDAQALLGWTLSPESTLAINGLPAVARPDILRWLAEAAGVAGRMVAACIEAGRSADAVPLGLVCDVVFSPDGEGQADLGHAAIRLERYVGDTHLGVSDGRAWAAKATGLLASGDVATFSGALDRAQVLLRELRIEGHAALSNWLPSGLDARLAHLADALGALLDRPTSETLPLMERATDRVLAHRGLFVHPQRAELVRMARRLARWIARPESSTSSVPDIALWQADEGAYVDWSRFRLLGGDESPVLSAALARLRDAAMARRESLAQRLARALPDWVARDMSLPQRLVYVEDVLSRVVAPLAAQHPVLLMVVDGMSTGIFRELFNKPQRHGWAEWVPEGLVQPLAAIAAIPSVTEASRTSLLCGRRMLGSAPQEKVGFASHPDLLAHSETSAPPRLFHKGDLADDGQLAPELREALANPKQRVVGVVYNAVDDHLSGPDQLHQRWQLEDLRLMLPLLREARDVRRIVIVTADHGHVLDDGSRAVVGGQSDRWRAAGPQPTADELLLRGPRVLNPEGGNEVVCLWGDRTRYSTRRTGYHGGVAPQELVVPLSVLSPTNVQLAGWNVAPPLQPDWWDSNDLAASAPRQGLAVAGTSAPATTGKRKAAASAENQPALFAPEEAPPSVPSPSGARPPSVPQDWIANLLSSPAYASQRQLAARVALPNEQLRSLLAAIDERGGKLGRTALAQRLGVPEMRLGGIISAAKRVLNLDQAEILIVHDAENSVTLNRALLFRQFGLPAARSM
ncbi:MAG: BREX-2 system phosphatase PglZ [Ramlibacter sp.]